VRITGISPGFVKTDFAGGTYVHIMAGLQKVNYSGTLSVLNLKMEKLSGMNVSLGLVKLPK